MPNYNNNNKWHTVERVDKARSVHVVEPEKCVAEDNMVNIALYHALLEALYYYYYKGDRVVMNCVDFL